MSIKMALDDAIALIVKTVETLRTDGATQDTIKAAIKHRLFDEQLIDKNGRQIALKQLNKLLGTTYSMTQIRQSPAWVTTAIETGAPAVQAVEVDELHGSVNLPSSTTEELAVTEAAPSPAGCEKPAKPAQEAVAVTVKPEQVQPGIGVQAEPVVQPAAPAAQTQSNTTSQEENTMLNTNGWNAQAQAQTEARRLPSLEEATNQVKMFFAYMGFPEADGYKAFEAFVNFYPAEKAVADAIKANFSDLPPAVVVCMYLDAEPQNSKKFAEFVKEKYTPQTEAEAKASYSSMGGRDDGIKSSWLAVGAALVGGGLEMMTRGGGVSIASGVGTLAGAAASYFGADFIDEHIDSQFGRYVAAGSLGLALGAGGSAIGRAAFGSKKQDVMGNALEAPVGMESNEPKEGFIPGL